MKWLSLAVFLVMFAQSAAAQTLRVQSGDHVGFTRLVIPIGTERTYELVQLNGTTWDIEVEPAVEGYDISGTFELIQRTRLEGLETGQNLRLNLACECAVRGFRHQGQYLVVDIGDPDPNAVTTQPDSTQAEPEDTQPAAADLLPDLASLLRGPTQLPELNQVEDPPAQEHVPVLPGLGDAAPNPQLEQAAQIMAEQLARAAASGLLDASLNQPQSFADPVEEPNEPQLPAETVMPEAQTERAEEAFGQSQPEVAQPPEEIGDLPVLTQTALDESLQSGDLQLTISGDEACTGEPFDARSWAETQRFEQGLGALRLGLYDDRDRLVPTGAIALASYYLYYGFGAEAQHWLMQLPTPPSELLHVAALVDGAEQVGFEDVSSPEDCSQGELLWHYLGGAVSAELTSEDLAAVQRAYAELPTNLRDHLGPRLARMLHEERHGPAARNVRDILHRGDRLSDAELQLLDLDLGIVPAESAAETRNALNDMLMSGGTDTATTMAQALSFDRSVGIRPTAERLDAAEALLREYGPGPDTDVLWQEVLLGHAALGNVDTALAMLSDPDRGQQVFEAALTELIADRVSVEDTASLLVLAHSFGSRWRPEGSEAGRAQVAAIALLREEGLYEAAQILRDVRRPLILPAPDEDETILPDPLSEAWGAENWQILSDLSSGVHGEIAARMANRNNQPDAPVAPEQDLAAMEANVSDSRALREAIGLLLAQPSPE